MHLQQADARLAGALVIQFAAFRDESKAQRETVTLKGAEFKEIYVKKKDIENKGTF
jgi:hypothetical protein